METSTDRRDSREQSPVCETGGTGGATSRPWFGPLRARRILRLALELVMVLLSFGSRVTRFSFFTFHSLPLLYVSFPLTSGYLYPFKFNVHCKVNF